MKLLKRIKLPLLVLILCLTCLEVGLRLAGASDFAIYSVGGDIGYIPKPSQAGSFLNKNDWVFNDKSMATEQNWDPRNRFNILLIGNSIIMGGNPYAQKDKVAPLVQEKLTGNQMLWPIATGGWSVVNETVYLEQHPEVTHAANFFVWEYMHGELSQLSLWRGPYVFPDERPISALWYAVRRYVLPHFIDFNMDELPPVGETTEEHRQRFERQLAEFSKTVGQRPAGILLLYPTQQELDVSRTGGEWMDERQMLNRIASTYGLMIIDVSRNKQWSPDLYRDGTHPTVQGNVVLAKIIADGISSCLHSAQQTELVKVVQK